jgi:hypothetical protein
MGGSDSLLPSTVHHVNQNEGSSSRRTTRRRRGKNGSDGSSFMMICGLLSLALLAMIGLAYYLLHTQSGHGHHHPAKAHFNKNNKNKERKDTDFSDHRHVHGRREHDHSIDDDDDAINRQGAQRKRDSHVVGNLQEDRMKNLLKDPPPPVDPKRSDGRAILLGNKEKASRTLNADSIRDDLLMKLPEHSIYRLTTMDIMGNLHDLSQYIGKVTLLVNVACE